jgi:hypothetical protein
MNYEFDRRFGSPFCMAIMGNCGCETHCKKQGNCDTCGGSGRLKSGKCSQIDCPSCKDTRAWRPVSTPVNTTEVQDGMDTQG